MVRRFIGTIAVFIAWSFSQVMAQPVPQNSQQTESLSSAWVITPYGRSRLFVGDYDPVNQTLYLGWQIMLVDGWKTYWRSPGESGLPPQWHWQKKDNISQIEVQWPAPDFLRLFNLDNYIYQHEVILPIAVRLTDPARPVRLNLLMDYMVCAEICVPLAGEYRLAIPSPNTIKPSLLQKAYLDRYRTQVPVPLTGSGTFARLVVAPESSDQMLMIRLPDDRTPPTRIIVERLPGQLIGAAVPVSKQTFTQTKDKNYFSMRYRGKENLKGTSILLTFLMAQGPAYEVVVTVQ